MNGQSAAARAGISCALSRGAERALLIPGDCPRASAAELERLLASRSEAAAVTIVPDRHGSGTNALLVSPPGVIAPSFGAGSFERHLTAARAAGATVSVERPPSLTLDIDTGADLDALRASLAGDEGVAAHTRRVLDSLAEGTPLSFARP